MAPQNIAGGWSSIIRRGDAEDSTEVKGKSPSHVLRPKRPKILKPEEWQKLRVETAAT